jgi:competence protein ComEC
MPSWGRESVRGPEYDDQFSIHLQQGHTCGKASTMLTSYTDVHVLNVGRGSCTVVASPSGRTTMIDINDGGKLRPDEYEAIKQRSSLAFFAEAQTKKEEQLLDDPIDWYLARFGKFMHRFILSHPDMDHMSGIRRLLSHSSGIEVCNSWDYDHTRTRTDDDYPNNEAGWLDWQWYYGFHVGAEWENVTWPKRVQPMRGDALNYWVDDSMEILSPTTGLMADCDKCDEYNDASYAIKISHGPTSRLLAPGDVESKAWNDMIDAGVLGKINVLIASHHGRNSGFHEDAMEIMKPEFVIISSDEIPEKEDAINEYRKRARVFSTRGHGTLTVRMWDDGDVDVIDRDGTLLERMSDQVATSA